MTEIQTDDPSLLEAGTRPVAEEIPLLEEKSRRSLLWLWLLLVIFAGLAAGAAWYLWQQLQESRALLATQIEQRSAQLQTMQQQMKLMQEALNSGQERIESLQSKQAYAQESIAKLYAAQRTAGDKEDWSLAEISYLLTIAQQRLALAHDSHSALAALREADKRLGESGDPRYLPLREQLVKDIQALRTIKQVDLNGMGLRLNHYIEQADQLPLLQGKQQAKANTATINSGKSDKPDTTNAGETVWREMKKLVTIRYNQGADSALLSPQQRSLLAQNLRLQLENARFFLFRLDTARFQQTLLTAGKWLQTYYDLHAAEVKIMWEDLENLRQQELAPPLPDLDAALTLLRHFEEADKPVMTKSEQENPQ